MVQLACARILLRAFMRWLLAVEGRLRGTAELRVQRRQPCAIGETFAALDTGQVLEAGGRFEHETLRVLVASLGEQRRAEKALRLSDAPIAFAQETHSVTEHAPQHGLGRRAATLGDLHAREIELREQRARMVVAQPGARDARGVFEQLLRFAEATLHL